MTYTDPNKDELLNFIMRNLTNIVNCNITDFETSMCGSYVNINVCVHLPDGVSPFDVILTDYKKKQIISKWNDKADVLHSKIDAMAQMSDDEESTKKAAENVVRETKEFFYKILGIKEEES